VTEESILGIWTARHNRRGSLLFFFCREQKVSVVKSYTYDDGCESCGTDSFMREPFVVMFSSKYTGMLWKNGTAVKSTACL